MFFLYPPPSDHPLIGLFLKELIRHPGNPISPLPPIVPAMKQEDLDWVVYHHLSESVYLTPEEITAETGIPVPEIEASLVRLEQSLLVARKGRGCRLLAFQESLLACQCRHDPAGPLVIEDGVVRVKTGRKE